ncbi:MAG: 2-aminoethylphosphonate--pyruvate transaminase, partial [Rhodothermales bacterium]
MATAMTHRSEGQDKLLFTPGPLTTSRAVKEAMLRDLGSRDTAFIETVRRIRRRLLELAGVSQQRGYEAILMQGSGTFGLESVVSSTVPRGGRILVIVNGAYGERIVKMARVLGIDTRVLRYEENTPPDVAE